MVTYPILRGENGKKSKEKMIPCAVQFKILMHIKGKKQLFTADGKISNP